MRSGPAATSWSRPTARVAATRRGASPAGLRKCPRSAAGRHLERFAGAAGVPRELDAGAMPHLRRAARGLQRRRCRGVRAGGRLGATDPACAPRPATTSSATSRPRRAAPARRHPRRPRSACAGYADGMNAVIEVRTSPKKYGDVEAVHWHRRLGRRGEIFGFPGRTAPANPTIKILCTLLQPTSGGRAWPAWTSRRRPGRCAASASSSGPRSMIG